MFTLTGEFTEKYSSGLLNESYIALIIGALEVSFSSTFLTYRHLFEVFWEFLLSNILWLTFNGSFSSPFKSTIFVNLLTNEIDIYLLLFNLF